MKYEIRITTPHIGEVNSRTALLYARVPRADEKTRDALQECIADVSGILTPKVLYTVCPVSIDNDRVDLGFKETVSGNLAKHLSGCSQVIVMLATVGSGIDRYVARYQKLRPSRAYLAGAIGTERVEALCDAFETELSSLPEYLGCAFTKRYSPGYGDLSLSIQSDILSLLEAYKYAGITLSDGYLMMPSKTVTALIGVKNV